MLRVVRHLELEAITTGLRTCAGAVGLHPGVVRLENGMAVEGLLEQGDRLALVG